MSRRDSRAITKPGEIGEAFLAALRMLAAIITGPLLRRRRLTWGATPAESTAAMPGDEIIPSPRWQYTYGITIDAEPEDVWPWLVQIGQGRGGFYSHRILENLVGCRVRNADRVIPELQDLAIGDPIRLHPTAPALTVVVLEPGRDLVYAGDPSGVSDAEMGPGEGGDRRSNDGVEANTIWGFHLTAGERGTRLVVRGRSIYGDSLAERLAFGPAVLEPISYVMHRKMLPSIKRLVEESARGR